MDTKIFCTNRVHVTDVLHEISDRVEGSAKVKCVVTSGVLDQEGGSGVEPL